MTKRKKRTSWLTPRRVGGLGCAVALALGALFAVVLYQQVRQLFRPYQYHDPSQAGGTQDVAVERGAIDDGIFVYGQVVAARRASLGFRVARAKVLEFMASPGQQVSAGQVLVGLDRAALERNLAKARADLLAAQKKLDTVQAAGNVSQRLQLEVELNQVRDARDDARRALQAYDAGQGTPQARRAEAAAEVERARAALVELRENADRRRQLDELQVIYNRAEVKHGEMVVITNPSEQDRDIEWLLRTDMIRAREALEGARLGYEMEIRAAEQAVVAAERSLEALDGAIAAGLPAVERAKLAAALKQAEAAVQRAEDRLSALGDEVPVVAVAEAEAALLKAEGAVADAEAALAEAELVAPFDGLVDEVFEPAGGIVGPGTVVTLLDISTLKVEVAISDVDVARLKPGDEVRVTFDAFHGQPPLAGTLGEIPLSGEFDGAMTTFRVPVTVELGDVQLWVGMGANIYIPIERKEDVLLIPAAAVQSDGIDSFVWLVKGKGVERRKVELGVVDGVMAEVVEGLQEGDMVRMPLQGPVGPGPIYWSGG